jgi:uncharacterized spore protein YtfJ
MKVDELLQGAREAMSVRRAYGEPVEAGGVSVVPAAIVVGGGGGGGDADDNGGGGFGFMARPVGAWVIREGEVSWRPAIDLTLLAAIASISFLGGLRLLRR